MTLYIRTANRLFIVNEFWVFIPLFSSISIICMVLYFKNLLKSIEQPDDNAVNKFDDPHHPPFQKPKKFWKQKVRNNYYSLLSARNNRTASKIYHGAVGNHLTLFSLRAGDQIFTMALENDQVEIAKVAVKKLRKILLAFFKKILGITVPKGGLPLNLTAEYYDCLVSGGKNNFRFLEHKVLRETVTNLYKKFETNKGLIFITEFALCQIARDKGLIQPVRHLFKLFTVSVETSTLVVTLGRAIISLLIVGASSGLIMTLGTLLITGVLSYVRLVTSGLSLFISLLVAFNNAQILMDIPDISTVAIPQQPIRDIRPRISDITEVVIVPSQLDRKTILMEKPKPYECMLPDQRLGNPNCKKTFITVEAQSDMQADFCNVGVDVVTLSNVVKFETVDLGDEPKNLCSIRLKSSEPSQPKLNPQTKTTTTVGRPKMKGTKVRPNAKQVNILTKFKDSDTLNVPKITEDHEYPSNQETKNSIKN